MPQSSFSFWDSKKIVIILISAMAVFACVRSDQQAENQTLNVSGANGKEVYKLYCAACHGEDGKLNLNNASDLSQSTLTQEERMEIIKNGKGMMIPYVDILSEEELEAVAKYTQKLVSKKKGS